MTTGTDTTVVDDREIPTIDPSRIPQLVDNKRDWRGELDEIREQFPFFRVGDDPTIWVTRWEAARDVLADGELFYDTNWVENFGGTAAEYEGSGFQASQCGNSAAT